MSKLPVGIGLLVCLLLSCQKDKQTIDLGYDYFPVTEGLTRVYQVTDIFHDVDLLPAHDTNYYQIKEVIGEYETDDSGEDAHVLRRYQRADENEDWTIKDVWLIKRNSQHAITVEENQTIVNLGFGINSGVTWDANAFNTLAPVNCSYSNLYQPFNIAATLDFDSTCTVNHQDFISFVDYQKEFYVYAKHVGRVYSVYKDLTIDNFDTLSVQKGQELIYKLLEYSN